MASSPPMSAGLPVVDLASFGPGGLDCHRQPTARLLREACAQFGCAYVTNIGLSPEDVHEVFTWSKMFFDLPDAEKSKAPHPPTPMPHRGYSSRGREAVSFGSETNRDAATDTKPQSVPQIDGCKESFEVGSEKNSFQTNIWPPQDVLPGFQQATLDAYWRFHVAGSRILDALCTALELSEADHHYLSTVCSGENNQLRILHYPPIVNKIIHSATSQQGLPRMPAHRDWSCFTFVFQDNVGGLEFQDPQHPSSFIPASNLPGAAILSVGDMMERFSNGILRSALHRVTVPRQTSAADATSLPARYSIPYFFCLDHEARCFPLSSCVTESRPAAFEPVRWCDYGELMSRHMYGERNAS